MLDFKLYPLTKAILQLLGLALAAYTLYLIKGILVYAVIALYISVLGRPVLAFLGSLPKVGNSLSASVKALLTMVFFLLIALALASWVIPVLVREFSFLATIEYDALLRSLQEEWSHKQQCLRISLTAGDRQIQDAVERIANITSRIYLRP